MPDIATSKAISASNRLYDIPSLENDGSNFQTWKYRISTVLDVRGLVNLVDGSEVVPILPDGTKEADAAIIREKILDWQRRDKEARAQLTLTLKDEPLSGVIHAISAADVWDKLLRRYEGKGKQTVAFLTGEIFRGTFTDATPLEPQLIAVRHKAYILKTLNHELSDALVAIALIISLPESYSTLRTILMTTPEDQLTTDSVVTQVLTEERSRQNPNTSQVALLARTAKGKAAPQKSFGKKDDKRSSIQCNHCKKKGHIKSECRKLKAELAAKPDSSKGNTPSGGKEPDLSAKVVAVGKDDEDFDIRLFIANGIAKRSNLLHKWVVDSGCTSHMSSNRRWFVTFRELSTPRRVWLGDDSYILATGIGRIFITLIHPNGTSLFACLTDVYYVPELHGNLFSVLRVTQTGNIVNFMPQGRCEIVDARTNTLYGTAQCKENLYILNTTTVTEEHTYICATSTDFSEPDTDLDPSSEPQLAAFKAKVETSKATLSTWHRRLGHTMVESVRRLFRKKMVTGMQITDDDTHGRTCIPCILGKQTRTPIPKVADYDNPDILSRLFSDLCGPMQTQGRNGERYFMPLTDGKSRYVKVENMRLKSETFGRTKKLITRAEVETGMRVNFYHSDGGGEFTSAEMKQFLEERGIHHEMTNPGTPQQNGISERIIRTLVEMARTFLKDAGLPDMYWPYAILYAAYVLNRTPLKDVDLC